jgi:hypothetical protein
MNPDLHPIKKDLQPCYSEAKALSTSLLDTHNSLVRLLFFAESSEKNSSFLCMPKASPAGRHKASVKTRMSTSNGAQQTY